MAFVALAGGRTAFAFKAQHADGTIPVIKK